MTINTCLKNFMNNNDSIISNYFIWFEIKQTKCIKCSNEFYTFQYFPSFELNVLEYSLAINSDKRTYIQFYISLLKTKHLFIFSF